MEETTERFSREMEVIKRIVNGYLATDPILSGFELDSLGIKPKNDQDFEQNSTAENTIEPASIAFKGAKPDSHLRNGRCCVRASGKCYIWWGWGPCPNGDEECEECRH